MTDPTTTPDTAAPVHAMQDDWPNGVTPCCGIRSRDLPVGTHWTTWPAKITCPGAVDPAALIAATETTTPEPRCSAHGDARCAMCSRNDGPNCDGCGVFAEDGMHWDTCPNRDRTPLAEPEWLTDADPEPSDATEIMNTYGLRYERGSCWHVPGRPGAADDHYSWARIAGQDGGVRIWRRSAPAPVNDSSLQEAYARGYRAAANEALKNTVVTLTDKQVREVPAGEAREGDTVTRVGRLIERAGRAGGVIDYGDGVKFQVDLEGPGVTVSRPVSPLPDQPGTVIRCETTHWGQRLAQSETSPDGVLDWRFLGVDGLYSGKNIARVIDVLWLPAGAGVDEGGKP